MSIQTDECRTCGQAISLAEDGAWVDLSGACGCGIQEHEPGGFDQAAADALAIETPWYDNPPCPHCGGPDAETCNCMEEEQPYPVPCDDCLASIGEPCMYGCPNLD